MYVLVLFMYYACNLNITAPLIDDHKHCTGKYARPWTGIVPCTKITKFYNQNKAFLVKWQKKKLASKDTILFLVKVITHSIHVPYNKRNGVIMQWLNNIAILKVQNFTS